MSTPSVRPDDFSICYSWQAGSMPPPHHYSVGAEIQPDGSGTASMTPDYSGANVPTWSLRFQLDAEAFDALYTVLRLEGLFADDWQAPDLHRVGGSVWSIRAIADGQEVEVSGSATTATGAFPTPLREAVWAAVPKGIRTKLAIRRKVYVVTRR